MCKHYRSPYRNACLAGSQKSLQWPAGTRPPLAAGWRMDGLGGGDPRGLGSLLRSPRWIGGNGPGRRPLSFPDLQSTHGQGFLAPSYHKMPQGTAWVPVLPRSRVALLVPPCLTWAPSSARWGPSPFPCFHPGPQIHSSLWPRPRRSLCWASCQCHL